jgi:hypothetical protein
VVDGKIRETPVLELRRFVGSGVRAAISEQLGLPYLFGSGELSEGSDSGPETNLGADCTNFVVYAMRRQGHRVPWSDPKQLPEHLDLVARSAMRGRAKINAEDLQHGMIIHLDTHVAAVMEDRQPVGILDENDLVAHQLMGSPQMLTLGELLRERKKKSLRFVAVSATKRCDETSFWRRRDARAQLCSKDRKRRRSFCRHRGCAPRRVVRRREFGMHNFEYWRFNAALCIPRSSRLGPPVPPRRIPRDGPGK